jgi:hypothetical protein
MDSSAKNSDRGVGKATPLKQEIVLPEIRLITQAERDSLREMANTVCAKVLLYQIVDNTEPFRIPASHRA